MPAAHSPIAPHGGQPVVTQGGVLADSHLVVIMVHGRGASPASILELVPAIDPPGVAQVSYLAPGASGGAWYPMSFMAPTERNEPGITSGIGVVHDLIEQVVAAGVPTERVVLLGFSQGACLVSTAAQRRPARYGGVIVYSGGLIGPPGTVWMEQGSFHGTPVFLGCSDRDAHIPEERVRASAAVFERMGATVTLRIYEGMGHSVNDDETEFTRALLAVIAGS